MELNILILDDCNDQIEYISNILNELGPIIKFTSGPEALSYLEKNSVDIIVCDMHMPVMNGISFYKKIKCHPMLNNTPFFFLSGDETPNNIETGLLLGPEDFISALSSPNEIKIRIKNRMEQIFLRFRDLSINTKSLNILIKNKPIETTTIEYKILATLVKLEGNLISKEQLKNLIWPGTYVLDRTINTHLSNIRHKLEDSTIIINTIKGEGIQLI